MAILNNNPLIGSGGQQGYSINNSLRFRSSASAYLNRTPPSTGNNITWTYSGWVKRGKLGSSQDIFGAGDLSSIGNFINFTTSDTVDIYYYNSGYVWRFVTTQVFRDPSAWYHIVVAYDATQATNTNRLKLYVNGVQVTAFSTATYPALNQTVPINSGAIVHYISDTANYFDGYLSEVNFIDGSAKTPSDFGETDTTTGVWKPKAYTGTYGTNGFYLKFSDIATTSGSNAGLGKDFSGNSNYWTTNNISVTSGTTYDAMKDVPTNTSATVANYCTLNPIATNTVGVGTLSNANLNFSIPNTFTVYGTMSASSGKYYWEAVATSSPIGVGIKQLNVLDRYSNTIYYMGSSLSTGEKYVNGTGSAYGASWTTGDVIGVAVDMDGGTVTFYKNNASQGSINLSLATITEFVPTFVSGAGATFVGYVNFGQRPFTYTPPTGYVALNTYNLPTPTILQGNKYMDATTYTGTGSSLAVTNAGAFKPDFLWVKDRSRLANHILVDSVRGVNNLLRSESTAAEAAGSFISSLNSNGFTLSANTISDSYYTNVSGDTFVGWQWQAGQGSTSSNTSGSITSTVSVNATAGFSVATFTLPASGTFTVGHGLGVAPAMMILKCRGTAGTNWVVYHQSLGNTKWIPLNLTNAASTDATWNNTSPTSTVFTGNTVYLGNSLTYVAYCWAEIAGFSKFTSYTGNGSADGPFVYTGFRPKFVLIKRTVNAGGSWAIYDTARNTYNVANLSLYPNLSNADDTYDVLDFTSNGFKIRTSSLGVNQSGDTFIVAAFAESPFSSNNRAR